MLMDKFKDVPVEKETKVISRKIIKLDTLEAQHEKWRWDGITAQSIVFAEADIKDQTEEQLIILIKANIELAENADITISRDRNGFAFFNLY